MRDPKIRKRYVDQQFCSNVELEVLSKFAEDALYVLSTQSEKARAKDSGVAETKEFRKFRSWYKGGHVVVQHEEAQLSSG